MPDANFKNYKWSTENKSFGEMVGKNTIPTIGVPYQHADFPARLYSHKCGFRI